VKKDKSEKVTVVSDAEFFTFSPFHFSTFSLIKIKNAFRFDDKRKAER